MKLIFATILEARQHPLFPLRVELDLGNGTVEQWVMCAVGAWAAVKEQDLVDVQCLVLDTELISSPRRWVVLDFLPSAGLFLPDNRKGLARVGAAVGIKGAVMLRPEAIAAAALNPLGYPLGHDLEGRLVGDE
jgi:hypothetical protein